MKDTTRLAKRAVLFGAFAIAAGSAVGQGMPKEGRADTTNCWSGTSNLIAFSKTHSALSFEFLGTSRSNPRGGVFDMTTFRCVGMVSVVEGKSPGTVMCETVDKDGDKWFSQFVGEGARYTGTALAGTGKYEGIAFTTASENIGPFPTIKPGTFQNCNRSIGTYKLR